MQIRDMGQLTGLLALMRADTLEAQALTTEMDAEIAAIKARFEGRIKERQDAVKIAAKAVQIYAETQRKSLLTGQVKSCFIHGHEIGWRDNGGAIKMIKGVTEARGLERLMNRGGQLAKLFIRRKPSLDKEAMRARWQHWKAKLMPLGFRFVREEIFFVELDLSKQTETTVKPEVRP